MKLCYFSGAIEVAPRGSWNERLEFNTDDNGKLSFRYPYDNVTPEQAAAVSEFTKTLTAAYNKLQKQIDNVNQDLKLEQYAPIVPPVVETNGSDFDLDANPAVSQSARGVSKVSGVVDSYSIASIEPEVLGESACEGSDPTDLVAHSEAEQERLDMEEEQKESLEE